MLDYSSRYLAAKVDIDEVRAVDPHLRIVTGKVVVVLTDIDHVATDGLDPHSMTEVANVPDSYRMGSRRIPCRNAVALGVSGPLVGVAYTTPVRHVAVRLLDFPGGIADAFAVKHTPGVDN
jgi:hypothetical protein